MPKKVHNAIQWSKQEPFQLEDPPEEERWHIHEHQTKASKKINTLANKKPKLTTAAANYIPAKGSMTLNKLSEDKGRKVQLNKASLNKPAHKKKNHHISKPAFKATSHPNLSEVNSPLGVVWDASSYSCAYDALFTILYSMWREHTRPEYQAYARTNVYWNLLHNSFQEVSSKTISLERT